MEDFIIATKRAGLELEMPILGMMSLMGQHIALKYWIWLIIFRLAIITPLLLHTLRSEPMYNISIVLFPRNRAEIYCL